MLSLEFVLKDKTDFKVRGLTPEQKYFLYTYAQEYLGSRSRNKAILHLIDEKIQKDKSIIHKEFIKKEGE